MADIEVRFQVNGETRSAHVPPMKRLLDVLREDLKLTGTKEGCGEGECGACSVFVDGKLVNSCLVPAAQASGTEILTVEGLSGSELHPLQEAFLGFGGAQCGICTPGMIMAAYSLFEGARARGRKDVTDSEIREALAGNLCRCTGYTKIIESVRAAIERGTR